MRQSLFSYKPMKLKNKIVPVYHVEKPRPFISPSLPYMVMLRDKSRTFS